MSAEPKVKRMCPECGHKHRNNTFCHAYMEAAVDDEEDGADAVGGGGAGDEEEEDEDDEDADLLGTKMKKGPTFKKKEAASDELPTPFFVQAIRYTRCNCQVGVPLSREYEQVGRTILCGNIVVKQYDDIINGIMAAPPKLLSAEEEEVAELARTALRNKKQMEVLPLVMRFLREGHCSAIPMVCATWSAAAEQYQEYCDVRNMRPWQAYRLHKGEVCALCLVKPRVFSGGDKRILASDIFRGELEGLVTRDSGDVTHLSVSDRGELFAASTNGSVRTYGLNHNPRMIKVQKTMWDHSRAVTTVLLGVPSVGPCVSHGLDNHVCWMYTSSEDRSLRVWNLEKYSPYRGVTPAILRRQTITQLAQSGRHLFAGTSAAQICIFSKFDRCERDDVHGCNTPGADKTYCLQVILKLPPLLMSSGLPAAVTSLKCTGYDYTFTHLWAADSTGQLTVWFVPEEGIEFLPAKTWKGHRTAVNAMASTWKHMVTVGDDGMLLLYELDTLALIRRMDLREWCVARGMLSRPDIQRRLKSIDIEEDQESGGMMVVGTNYGDIIVMSIGRYV